jgi:phosphoribosylaminoimidazolecarboxamide formyltransferase/IMP cyclohydrolase
MDFVPIRRAILSVTDKSGLAEFASFLAEGGVELVSTGGTKKALTDAGLAVTAVDQVTGFPEVLGGRVKTLHPHIHAGILADKDKGEHMETLAKFGLKPFDLVCVNLYDFGKAKDAGATLRDAVEQIDIGGPTMLRAAAKNFHSVLVAPKPLCYGHIMAELKANGMGVSIELRREMAVETFKATSAYDAMIAGYLEKMA